MKLLYDDYQDRQQLARLSEAYKVPGFNYCLIKDGKAGPVRCYGFKDFQDGKYADPVKEDTAFEAASLTKCLFATIVMRLVDRGVIGLDDKLAALAPELKVSDDPRIEEVTVRQVLSHGSGLIGWGDRPHLPFLFNPGESYSYSGEGYYWLQHLIDKLTGKLFVDHMKDELIKPLSMDNSAPIFTPEIMAIESHKFDAEGKVMAFRTRVDDDSSVPEPNAAWSLYSGAGDYAKFMEEILNNHGHMDENLFNQMTSPQNKATEAVYWGLGWGIPAADTDVIWHWGDNGGYRSFTAMDLETKDGLCIFTNGFNGTGLCIEFLKMMTGDSYWDDVACFIAHAED